MLLLLLIHSSDQDQKDVDDAEALAVLQALYTMTFTPQGRDAAVYVLGLEDNVDIFMPFIQVTGKLTVKSLLTSLNDYKQLNRNC